MTFWEHVDELRKALVRPLIAVVLMSVVAFCLKDFVFGILLAANSTNFAVYGLAEIFSGTGGLPVSEGRDVYVKLISTELTSQFMTHMKVSLYVGLMLALPFVFYCLFRYVSPALYEKERKYSFHVMVFSFISFYAGILVNYFIIFPFSLRFLADYHVSGQIENTITITSYVSTLLTLSVLMGIFFELPVMAWVLSKLGLLSKAFLRKYRKHAIVAILILAAIITPTTDIFTLLLVSLPIWLLYELSIVIAGMAARKEKPIYVAEPEFK